MSILDAINPFNKTRFTHTPDEGQEVRVGEEVPMNRAERRKNVKWVRGIKTRHKEHRIVSGIRKNKSEHQEAVKRKQEAAHKRAMVRKRKVEIEKKKAAATQLGVAQTHTDRRRANRYEEREKRQQEIKEAAK